MAFLISTSFAELLKDPSGLWEWLILNVFSFITNYGWRILLFTVILKLVMVPLDIYQRVKMRKNQLITERMKPQLDKLQQQFGSNKQVLSQKTMELNKKEGFSYFSSCLPMIVTMVIFFYLFSGLNNISQYKNLKQYVQLYDVYTNSQEAYKNTDEYKDFLLQKPADENSPSFIEWKSNESKHIKQMTEKAKGDVETFYASSGKESFLWVKNIWSPDVPWTKPILSKSAFNTAIGKYTKFDYAKDKLKINSEALTEAQFTAMLGDYEMVTDNLAASSTNKVNGLLILPILSIGLSFLSQFITSRLQKKSGQAGPEGSMGTSMKMMMFIMPIMMGFFALQYTSAFTLYIVVNSGMTILINVFTTLAMSTNDKKVSVDNPAIVHKYGRPDPNEQTSGKVKKIRKSKIEKNVAPKSTDVIYKYGRPDPNAPKMSDKDKKKK